MNIKEYIVPLGLGLLTVWGFQYFLGDKQTGTAVQPGQTFVAPEQELACKPLNKDVDFIDGEQQVAEKQTEVATKHAHVTFSTHGGALQRLEFKRKNITYPLTTVFPVGAYDHEDACFLVGLQEKTPYYYELVSVADEEDQHTVVYRTKTADATIEKRYTVYDDSYKIDLNVTITPKHEDSPIRPRLLYPAPILPDIQKDTISAVYTDKRGSIKKTSRSSLNAQQGWIKPTLFGADDRYFVHAMVSDDDHFAQRSYYKISGNEKLFSFLEGPTITKQTSWNLSFYFGPKEEKAFAAVDERLEQTLDYSGILKPIALFLLYILNLFYVYVGNYGLAIILLTLLVKLVLLPFTFKGEASMQKMKQKDSLDKKLRHLQHKYKDDPQRLAHERAELIKKHGLPGLGGCLPLLLQIPIFWALARVLSSSIALYKAPFYLWITDLSAPDPYYGLPLLLVAGMLLQATTADKSQRTTLLLMALVFGVMTASLPAGFALYILTNTLLGIGQTALVKKIKA